MDYRGACPTGPGGCDAVPRLDLSTTLFLNTPFPTTVDPGEKIAVRAVMQNTSALTWSTTANHLVHLNSNNRPSSFWGSPRSDLPVGQTVAPGATRNFDLIMHAPETPGTYDYDYVMRDSGNGNFGTHFLTSITVTPRQRVWDCTLVSHTVPPRIGTGRATGVTFTVQNTGTGTWVAPPTASSPDGMRLCQNDDNTFGATNCINISSNVPPGGTVTIPWTLIGPPLQPGQTEATFTLAREMKDQRVGAVNFFNDFSLDGCVVLPVTVQLCGDNIPLDDAAEECDDGNTINGDGCDDTCHFENPRVVDLASQSADRTIFGRGENKGLANVAFGDVVGDTLVDVCVGEIDSIFVPGTSPPRSRNVAGRVSCYDGAGFFGGADVTTPTGAAVEIVGASPGDHIGGTSGRIVIGDINADGAQDLIMSAPFADGPGETRADCGEIYIIPGGQNLSGSIDVGNPGSVVITTIYGPTAGGGINVLTFGDVDGDGFRDVVIGMPYDDTNGTNSGKVIVLQGGPALTAGGTIDLATTTPYATFLGGAPGDMVGFTALLGDLLGTAGGRDLVLGAYASSPSGRTRAGSVYVFATPLVGGIYDLATQYDLQIIGARASERLGTSLAIGNVKGPTSDNRPELVVGVPGAVNASSVRTGRVDVWLGPLTIPAGRVIDTLTDEASTQIWGLEQDDRWGSSIALGHWNDDHRLDIAIASDAADGPGNTRDACGEMVLVLGHQNLPSQLSVGMPSPLRVYGDRPRAEMGAHVLNLAFGADLDAHDTTHGWDLCVGTYRGNNLAQGRVDCFSAQ